MGLRLASQRTMAIAAQEHATGRPTWFVSLGSSMSPSIKTVQRVKLRPVRPGEPLIGRVALADVRGRWWLHRVSAETGADVHIVSDSGMVNGWTPRTAVFGVVD
jgi:hypothetical protein